MHYLKTSLIFFFLTYLSHADIPCHPQINFIFLFLIHHSLTNFNSQRPIYNLLPLSVVPKSRCADSYNFDQTGKLKCLIIFILFSPNTFTTKYGLYDISISAQYLIFVTFGHTIPVLSRFIFLLHSRPDRIYLLHLKFLI